MLILKSLASAPGWTTLHLDNGDTLQVEITPPDFDGILRARVARSVYGSVLNRLECVTNWRDVLVARADGGQQELPFSREALGQVLRDYPEALAELLRILRPLFDGLEETERKNSPAPHDAATSPIPQWDDISRCGASDGSPKA